MSPQGTALSCLLTHESGAAADIIATGNQHRRYYITRTGHADPATALQVYCRNRLQIATAILWSAMLEPQRAKWELYDEAVREPTRLRKLTRIGALGHWTRSATTRIRFIGTASTLYAPDVLHCPLLSPVRITYAPRTATSTRIWVYFNPNDEWFAGPTYPAARLGFLGIAYSNPVPGTRNTWYRAFPNTLAIVAWSTPFLPPRIFTVPHSTSAGERLFFRVRAMTSDYRSTINYTPQVQHPH